MGNLLGGGRGRVPRITAAQLGFRELVIRRGREPSKPWVQRGSVGAERAGRALGDGARRRLGRDWQKCTEEMLELPPQGCREFAKGGRQGGRRQSRAKAQRCEKRGLLRELSLGPGAGRGER